MNSLQLENILLAKQEGLLPIDIAWMLYREEKEKQRSEVDKILENTTITLLKHN